MPVYATVYREVFASADALNALTDAAREAFDALGGDERHDAYTAAIAAHLDAYAAARKVWAIVWRALDTNPPTC